MPEREPAVLHDEAGSMPDPPWAQAAGPARDPERPKSAKREAPTVHVAGFWKRALAGAIDLAIVLPAALHVTDVDLWIDLVLATDPALVMGLVLCVAIGLVYLVVFQIVAARTLGMRVMGLRIIDVYGEPPSPARCLARTAGYLASAATLFLGYLWIGFDSEKRGLQDWIAGTYVIRA
jgi:uncharacterized RDD family membrane protein YckC